MGEAAPKNQITAMKTLSTYVSKDVRERVEAEAERYDMSISQWLHYQLRQMTNAGPPKLKKRPPLNELEGEEEEAAA